MNGACNGKYLLAHPPGALRKGQILFHFNKYHFISITKSISKIFIQNSVCFLKNERFKTYQTGFSFCHLGHAQVWDFGALGVPRGSFFIKHVHVAYQIDGDDKQNRLQVK